jgi:hypothetical protein
MVDLHEDVDVEISILTVGSEQWVTRCQLHCLTVMNRGFALR